MSEAGRFTINLEQLDDYQFNVKFDLPKAADVLMDEPPPLGERAGPNASRMLAAAAANCLSASLLFCLTKTMDQVPANALKTEATGILVRDEKKRLRVGGLEVTLRIDDQLVDSPRLKRCMDLFEDFCVVSASIRQGIPIKVTVQNSAGEVLHEARE
jgi:organic hydroperoxide reductase OsmC/OhrA